MKIPLIRRAETSPAPTHPPQSRQDAPGGEKAQPGIDDGQIAPSAVLGHPGASNERLAGAPRANTANTDQTARYVGGLQVSELLRLPAPAVVEIAGPGTAKWIITTSQGAFSRARDCRIAAFTAREFEVLTVAATLGRAGASEIGSWIKARASGTLKTLDTQTVLGLPMHIYAHWARAGAIDAAKATTIRDALWWYAARMVGVVCIEADCVEAVDRMAEHAKEKGQDMQNASS